MWYIQDNKSYNLDQKQKIYVTLCTQLSQNENLQLETGDSSNISSWEISIQHHRIGTISITICHNRTIYDFLNNQNWKLIYNPEDPRISYTTQEA